MNILSMITDILVKNGLVMAFIFVGVIIWLSGLASKHLTNGRIASSAIAIFTGLALAFIGGVISNKTGAPPATKGLADISLFSGIGVMGGGMLRDYAIISTSFGAKLTELKKAGLAGLLALFIGIIGCFFVTAIIAYMFGYRSAVDVTTIAAGAVTFIVGPVTGAALGASSEIIAISIAAGVVKSVFVMILTPILAKPFGINNPQAAMVYGGLMGTTSGTAAGLAATDPRLVPYGAVVATFYTGFGCLLAPSILYLVVKAILG